jgi:hypothetical protein
MPETTFSIVGTAGRKDDAKRLTKNHFDAMCECARLMLKQFSESDYGVDTLVSGGAAWADHVAVRLFLNKEIPKLKLFLPCQFLGGVVGFDPTPLNEHERTKGWSTGETVNRYHGAFTRKCGFNSLGDIELAIQQGAQTFVCKGGFYGRNALVAKSDIILAMTFGDKEWLKDGGTADTMLEYLNRVKKLGFFDKSFHYDLNSGEIFAGARVKAADKSKI